MCMHIWHMCVSMMLSIELTAGWDWRGHFHYYTIALIKRFLGIRWSLWAVWILNILSFVLVKRANITEYLPRRRLNCIVQSEIKIFEALIKNMYICIIALDWFKERWCITLTGWIIMKMQMCSFQLTHKLLKNLLAMLNSYIFFVCVESNSNVAVYIILSTNNATIIFCYSVTSEEEFIKLMLCYDLDCWLPEIVGEYWLLLVIICVSTTSHLLKKTLVHYYVAVAVKWN